MANRPGSAPADKLAPAGKSNLRPPTQPRSHESTQALLTIGRRLIEERGIDDCSMSDVAIAAGSSVGSLYFRFGNKERFVSEIMQRHVDTTLEELKIVLAEIAAAAKSPRDVIEAMTRWVVRGFDRNQRLVRAQIRRALDAPQEWRAFQGAGRDMVDGTIWLLERFPEVGQDDEWRKHVRIAMQMVFGTLNNMLIHRPGPLELSDRETAGELSRAVIRFLGWEAPRGTAKDKASPPGAIDRANRRAGEKTPGARRFKAGKSGTSNRLRKA